MTDPIEFTHSEITQTAKENVTYGRDPRGEQIKRQKQVIKHLEEAQEHLARMGVVYAEFNCPLQEEYCQSLYLSLHAILESIRVLRQDM